MTANISMRIRIIALGGLLAALLIGAATFMMSGSDSDAPEASAPASPAPSRPQGTDTQAATPQGSKPTPTAAAPKAPVEPVAAPVTDIPAAVVTALALHDVVVVSLVSPNAALDRLAADEARAGAKRAGAGFVKVEVANRKDLKRMTAELGVRHTPTVLVFTRPDRLFVKVTGFADRETVAQAAANAS